MPSAKAPARTVLLVSYRLFANDWAAWLTETGHRVEWLVPQALTADFLRAACSALAPRFIASINFSPELAFLATLAKTPYVSWTVDPIGPQRTVLYGGTNPKMSVAFAHRRSTVQRLVRAGIADATFLPLGAPVERRSPARGGEEAADGACDVSFVGSSLANEAVELDRIATSAGGEPLAAAFREFVERADLEHEGDVEYSGIPEDGTGLPRELLARFGKSVPAIDVLADKVNGALSHALCARRVKALSPFGLSVYGDPGWAPITPAYRGAAEHDGELTRIYNLSAINLDVPRVYQRDIVTMRVFDILACGGLVLTEPSADLSMLFADGSELVTYRNTSELDTAIRELLRSPETRASIGRAGCEAVLARHRLSHRFEAIEAALVRRGVV